MKTIKFRKQLAEQILRGEKTSTWRLFDDKDLQKGDLVEFLIWETGEKFAEAEIVEARVKRLGDIIDSDFEEGHERYESADQMIEVFRKYYGERVDANTEVKILKFTLT